MANFQKIIPFILKMEGHDVFTDIPEDKGGATKYGISINFAEDTNDLEMFDLDGDNEITKKDIKLLDSETALKVYKKYF